MAFEFPEEKLLAAAFLFESANGYTPGSFEATEIASAGFEGIEPSIVAAEICGVLDGSAALSQAYRAAAFFALGKRHDTRLRDFFRRHLATESSRDMQVAYQIMIALDNLKEPIWPSVQSSKSSSDEEQNRDAAMQYLSGVE